MRAGKLRHRIGIYSITEENESGDYGQPNQEETPQETVWGSVEPLRGNELFIAQQIAPETTHRVRLRGGSEVKTTQRLKYDDRWFCVVAALDPEERGISQELLCKEDL